MTSPVRPDSNASSHRERSLSTATSDTTPMTDTARASDTIPTPRSPSSSLRTVLTALAIALALGLLLVPGSGELAAQQGPGAGLAGQSMRPYAHVFWAYALGWALILGWVISIGRRWSRVEDDLQRRSGSE